MKSPVIRAALGVCLLVGWAVAGPNQAALYERLVCVVPMIGVGTMQDPRRPMFTPSARDVSTAETNATLGFLETPKILAYHSVLSDDGQFAIVEFVAKDCAAFREILSADLGLVKRFNPGEQAADAVLTQLRRYKKNFDFKSFRVGVQ